MNADERSCIFVTPEMNSIVSRWEEAEPGIYTLEYCANWRSLSATAELEAMEMAGILEVGHWPVSDKLFSKAIWREEMLEQVVRTEHGVGRVTEYDEEHARVVITTADGTEYTCETFEQPTAIEVAEFEIIEARNERERIKQEIDQAREDYPNVFGLLHDEQQAIRAVTDATGRGRQVALEVAAELGPEALSDLFVYLAKAAWDFDLDKAKFWLHGAGLLDLLDVDTKGFEKLLDNTENLVALVGATKVSVPTITVRKK